MTTTPNTSQAPFVLVDPVDYDVWVDDAYGVTYKTNSLPLDEWECSACSTKIGWISYDDKWSTGITFRGLYILQGRDLLAPDTVRICEDCHQYPEVD